MVPQFQNVTVEVNIGFENILFSLNGQVSGQYRRVLETCHPEGDALSIGVYAVPGFGMKDFDFKEVFPVSKSACNVAYAYVAPVGFGDDLLPFFFGFDSSTVGNPKFLDGECLDERKGSAEMVLVRMRDDECVQVRYPDMVQVGDDDVLP